MKTKRSINSLAKILFLALLFANFYNAKADNIAIGKTATYSVGNFITSAVTDNNMATNFQMSTGTTLTVNLGGSYLVEYMNLQAAFVASYKLEYSLNNGAWTTLVTMPAGGANFFSPTFTATTCDKIKFTLTSYNGGPGGAFIYELGIFNRSLFNASDLLVAGTSSFNNSAYFYKGAYFSGSVGIGSTTALNNCKLAVEGKIGAREVNVLAPGVAWPDYVFDKSYKLTTLEELNAYIQKNNHLPEIPSACVIEKNGIDLGEMNNLLMKKVEELTLYLIEQNNQISELKEQSEFQKRQIEILQK